MNEIISFIGSNGICKEFGMDNVVSYYNEPGFIRIKFKDDTELSLLKFDPKKKDAIVVDSETYYSIFKQLVIKNVVDNTVLKI